MKFLLIALALVACAPEKPACSIAQYTADELSCRARIKADCKIDPATGKYDLTCPTVVDCYKMLDAWQVCQ